MKKTPDSREIRTNILNSLVFKKFPNVSLEIFNGAAKAITLARIDNPEATRKESSDPHLAYYYREELSKLTHDNLEKLFQSQEKEIESLLNEEIRQKEAELFNQNNMGADYEYWNKADLWSVEECLVLTLEKDPRMFSHNYISNNRYYKTKFSGEHYSELVKKYDEIFSLIERSIDSGLLNTFSSGGSFVKLEKTRIIPADYINWAKGKNIILPEEILKITDNKIDNFGITPEEELSKVRYQIILSSKDSEPALYLFKNLGETKEEVFCHILRKENTTSFQDLFSNNKISLEQEPLKKFFKTINNIFDKIHDKKIRSRLRDSFFEKTASSITLKTKEISF